MSGIKIIPTYSRDKYDNKRYNPVVIVKHKRKTIRKYVDHRLSCGSKEMAIYEACNMVGSMIVRWID